uniref:SH3 domain-containing protein n=1 Tax=Monopterus albus TaxID=43700 RepID=A0A3Q3ITA3_MONAL
MCMFLCHHMILFPQLFILALFDYDPNEDPTIPCKDAAIAFKRGDVLQIVSMDDDTWWQACHLRDSNSRAGFIPSKQLHDRCSAVVLTIFIFSTCSTDEREGTVCLNLLLKPYL